MKVNQSKKRLMRMIYEDHVLPGVEVPASEVHDALLKMPSRIAAVEKTKSGHFLVLQLGDQLKAGKHRYGSIASAGAASSFREAESVEATDAIARNYKSNLAKNKKQYDELYALLAKR